MTAKPAREFWMLLRRGRVQWFTNRGSKGVIFATSRTAAAEFAREKGVKASPALVGSVDGESLESVIGDSFNAGADTAFVVDDDGKVWCM